MFRLDDSPQFCNLLSWYVPRPALASVDVVGVQEFFGTSLCLIYWTLGLAAFQDCPLEFVERINRSKNNGTAAVERDHPELAAGIRRLLQPDLELYAAARRKFFGAVAEMERVTGLRFEEVRGSPEYTEHFAP